MSPIEIRLDFIDNYTRELQNVYKINSSTFKKMSEDQQKYSQAVVNSSLAIAKLQVEKLNSTEKQKSLMNDLIKLEKSKTEASKEELKVIQQKIKETKNLVNEEKLSRKQMSENISQQRSFLGLNKTGLNLANNIAKKGAISGRDDMNSIKNFAVGSIVADIAVKGAKELVEYGKAVIETRAEFEKLEAVLTTSVGKNTAQKYFQEIKQFSTEVPVEVKDITDAFVKLGNKIPGLVFSKKSMKAITDLALASNAELKQVVEAITIGGAKRFHTLGIGYKERNGIVTISGKGLNETFKNTAENRLAFAEKMGLQSGVAGMSENIMDTIGGKITNVNDQFTNLRDNIGLKFQNDIKATQNTIIELISWMNKMTEVPLSEKLQNEKTNVDNLYKAITNLNTPIEIRNRLYKELLEKYPEHFSALEKDKLDTEKLTHAVNEYNEAMKLSIKLQNSNEKLEGFEKDKKENEQTLNILYRMKELIVPGKEGGNQQFKDKSDQDLYETLQSKLPITVKWYKSLGNIDRAIKHYEEINKDLDKNISSETKTNTALERPSVEKNFKERYINALNTPKNQRTEGQNLMLEEISKDKGGISVDEVSKRSIEDLQKYVRLSEQKATPNAVEDAADKERKEKEAARAAKEELKHQQRLQYEKFKTERQKEKDQIELEKGVTTEMSTNKNIHQINTTISELYAQKVLKQDIVQSKDLDFEKLAEEVAMILQQKIANISYNKQFSQ